MTRKWRECGLLRHLLSFFLTTRLKKQLISSRRPRSNMTVSKLLVYSSTPGYNCVLGCQRCRDHTFPSGFRLPPYFTTPEADVGPFRPQAPCCATRRCDSAFAPRGKDLILFSRACILHYFSPHISLSSLFPSFYLFSHHGHWS